MEVVRNAHVMEVVMVYGRLLDMMPSYLWGPEFMYELIRTAFFDLLPTARSRASLSGKFARMQLLLSQG